MGPNREKLPLSRALIATTRSRRSFVVCLFAKPHVISMAVSRGIPDKVDKCGDSDPGPPK